MSWMFQKDKENSLLSIHLSSQWSFITFRLVPIFKDKHWVNRKTIICGFSGKSSNTAFYNCKIISRSFWRLPKAHYSFNSRDTRGSFCCRSTDAKRSIIKGQKQYRIHIMMRTQEKKHGGNNLGHINIQNFYNIII
jgi:hypothetical protein